MNSRKTIAAILVTLVTAVAFACHPPVTGTEDAGEYIESGNSKAKQGDYDGALRDYDHAISIDRKNPKAYNNRGFVKQLTGDLEGAAEDYSKAIRYDSGFAEAFYNRGCVKQRLGELKEALKDLDKAIKIRPDYSDAVYRRGIVEFDLNENEAASTDFYRLIELTGKSELVAKYSFLRICAIKWKTGREAEAKAEAKAYVDEALGDQWVDLLLKFAAGMIDEEALTMASESDDAEANRERKCEAFFYMGQHRLASGDRDGAIELFKKCRNTKVDYFTEYYSAGYELERLAENP